MRIVAAGGADVTISSPVLSAGADGLTNATTGLIDYSLNSAFNGTTWDRLRSEGNDRDGITPDTLGNLQTLGFSHVYNGSTWDRATLLTDASDAVATDTSFGQGTVNRLTGFNGASYDRVRTLGGTSLDGLGQLSVSGAIPGASAVKSLYHRVAASTTTRETVLTPTSGKRIRIISIVQLADASVSLPTEWYFGTGANMSTTPANAITLSNGRADNTAADFQSWGDGAGPVGAADAVLSARNLNSSATQPYTVIQYREE
jgi:hypothetical protein